MSREELLLKNKDEIVSIAKEHTISQYLNGKRKTKEQLVDEILSKTESEKTETSVDDDDDWRMPKESKESEPITNEAEKETENDVKKEELTQEEKEIKKKAYVLGVKIGTLVAFVSSTGKVKSAKVIKRSTKNKKLKVETKYGAQFVISFDDVIWVRTNKRWPKGVYQLLKGVTDNGKVEV